MRNGSNSIFQLLLFVILFTGCSSRKHEVVVPLHNRVTVASLSSLPAADRDIKYLSCSLKMNASINAESVSAKGKLRIKANEGVQMSATAAGLMEAACFEFLPSTVRFIYKIDKVYAEAPYSAIPFLSRTGTDYSILESVMLNSIFSPDGTPLKEALVGMDIAEEDNYIIITTSPDYPVVYKFYIDKSNGNLVRCEGQYANGGSVVCNYGAFEMFDGTLFPQTVDICFEGDEISAALKLKVSNLKNREFIFSPRRVSDVYERVSIEGILGSMGNNAE